MSRIGIFGGMFNPFHNGHLNALTTVMKRARLDHVHVIPARQNPLKAQVEGPTPEQRLEMVRIALEEYKDSVTIDDRELKRDGLSYTIDTVNDLKKEYPDDDLFLIIGMDEFDIFDQWKNFEEILEKANLIVVTRPGMHLPYGKDEFPQGLQAQVEAFDGSYAMLKSQKMIEFVRLKDVDANATDIRKRLRTGKSTDAVLDLKVEKYIRDQGLFAPVGPRVGNYEDFVNFCAEALVDRKGYHVKAYDLRDLSSISEFTLIASGTSTRHSAALADHLVDQVKEEYGLLPLSVEGRGEGRWVVVDYGALIVHVFYDYVRNQYQLEEIWKGGRELPIQSAS